MLPYACIDSIMYTHEMRVYFSTQEQDEWGAIQREWTFDRTERGVVKQTQQQMYMVGELNSWNEYLVGHSEEDLRIDSNGNLYAPSEVLITFVNPPYIETEGPRRGLPTTFELRTSTPVEGPFGEVLHFDIQLVRSSNQDVILDEG
jgi:hypothetical protein